ncbi:MAG: hypothetical protein GY724_05210 [Actinomycetia bacterium]|nr:hypothetical protein [Actinomycetes bacterium]MCP4223131.1 hypothetical protein [Actinomycetes bacterium]MCP5032629.1 hypothetical protein [Actinomycetes bacterium]
MSDRLSELGQDTDVVLVTFTDPANLVYYRSTNDVPFPILVDPSRRAYQAFGLGRGSAARIYGWRAARRYWEILRTNGLSGLRYPREDTLQLGGDFIIAPNRTLAWGFWGEGPDDRPDVNELVAAINN